MKIVGIDEVGRGPLAGPMCIGIFISTSENLEKIVSRSPYLITDSKKITEKRRALLSQYFLACKKEKLCDFIVVSVDAEKIDKYGVSLCLKEMIKKGLQQQIADVQSAQVFLDGGLVAPSLYAQKTVIRGDASVPVISCASIVAKVHRDEYMKEQSVVYPNYFFEKNMGYGTSLHIEQIKKYGISLLHRKTFCKNIVV